jgi:hypothetical protein
METKKYFKLNSDQIHKKAIVTANNLVLSEARLIVLLGVIEKRKVFLKYRCPDIYSYGEKHLNLSRKKIFDLLQISRASQKIPALKTEIKKASVSEKTDFSYTKIRTLLPALLKINEEENKKEVSSENTKSEISTKKLLQKAKTKTSRELEKITREISPLPKASAPTPSPKWIGKNKIERVARLNQTQEALLSKAIDLICEEKKRDVSFEDFLEIVSQRVIENKLKRGKKRAQIFVSESEGSAKVANKNLGVLEIKEKIEIHVVEKNKKTTIPSQIKAKVIKRDEGKCVNCQKTKNIQIHHIKPKSQGGKNSSYNLVCLCSPCHSLFHQGYLEIEVNKGEGFKIKYKEDHIKTFADFLFEKRRYEYLNAKLANGRVSQKKNIQLNLV